MAGIGGQGPAGGQLARHYDITLGTFQVSLSLGRGVWARSQLEGHRGSPAVGLQICLCR